MPFLNKTETGNATVGVWSMTETWEELACMIQMTVTDKIKLERISNAVRKREFLVIRILLTMMIQGYPEILYSGNGIPYLKGNSRYLSITHSRNIAAVILSDRPAGIDAEVTGRNISGIAPRFLSEYELHWTSGTGDPELARLFCWCCKEAVYKMMNVTEVDFKKSIIVQPLVIGGQINTTAHFIHDGSLTEITINYFLTEENILAWCIAS
jgi:4'-phosphopantetheinyl transferase